MKKVFFNVIVIMALSLSVSSASAQNYCMWIVSHRAESLNELRVKQTTSRTFSEDLIPGDAITTGKKFWIKVTDWTNELCDIQITNMDGTPLMFHVSTTSGGMADFSYIRVNIKKIHTLSLNEDGTFSIYDDDVFGYGDPCQ